MAINRIAFLKIFLILIGLLLQSGVTRHVMAQPLDSVSLEYQETGIVATVRLTAPVQYLRHFPEHHGKVLEIFFNRVSGATSDEPWVDNEVRKSPPSTLIPGFKVTTRNQNTPQSKLVIEFERDADYTVAPGKDNRSLLIIIRPDKMSSKTVLLPKLPTVKPERLPPTDATLTEFEATMADNNKKARELLMQARDALEAGNNEVAVDAFNRLLLLPPNDYTEDAQEWVGVARERSGQIGKARVEYDLYLKIYPEGEGVVRVAQRLTALAGLPDAVTPGTNAAEEKGRAARWISYASVSPHYYFSHSTIDSTVIFNNTPTSSTQSMVDQSMLITNLDATERYVSEEYDGRLVFSDVSTWNFLESQPSRNRLNAAYGEIRNRPKAYYLRFGRQSSSGAGVLGRFDGISASYGNIQEMSISGVAGALSDFSPGSKPVFFGASGSKGPVTVYVINQRVEGTTDRQAMGAEFRYFEGSKTAFALLDYDTYFNELNAAQFMGTVGAYGGTANFMVDHRKAPTLSIRNALYGAGTSSVDDLLKSMSADRLRDLAIARTATSNMAQIGITIPLIEKWQVGGDIRITNTSGLPASGTTPLEGILLATPGRGTEKSVSGQAIGNSLYTDHDIWSASITFNTSSAVSGYSIYLYNYTLIDPEWTMNPSLQLFRQKDQFGSTTKLASPMIRGTYRIRDQLNLDMDGGMEFTDFSGSQQTIKTTRIFFSAGLRWDI